MPFFPPYLTLMNLLERLSPNGNATGICWISLIHMWSTLWGTLAAVTVCMQIQVDPSNERQETSHVAQRGTENPGAETSWSSEGLPTGHTLQQGLEARRDRCPLSRFWRYDPSLCSRYNYLRPSPPFHYLFHCLLFWTTQQRPDPLKGCECLYPWFPRSCFKTILETLSWKRKEIRASGSFISKFWLPPPMMMRISYQRHFHLQTTENLVRAQEDKQTEFITGLEQHPLEPPGRMESWAPWGMKQCTTEILENRCLLSPSSWGVLEERIVLHWKTWHRPCAPPDCWLWIFLCSLNRVGLLCKWEVTDRDGKLCLVQESFNWPTPPPHQKKFCLDLQFSSLAPYDCVLVPPLNQL